jgi:hypothetical protein
VVVAAPNQKAPLEGLIDDLNLDGLSQGAQDKGWVLTEEEAVERAIDVNREAAKNSVPRRLGGIAFARRQQPEIDGVDVGRGIHVQ